MPNEQLFELSDFLVFDELKIACDQLPPEDVAACLQHVRTALPNLDIEPGGPNNALGGLQIRCLQ